VLRLERPGDPPARRRDDLGRDRGDSPGSRGPHPRSHLGGRWPRARRAPWDPGHTPAAYRGDRQAVCESPPPLVRAGRRRGARPDPIRLGGRSSRGTRTCRLELGGRAMSGIVHLVGAGPGDPELLTLRARRLLDEADVVVHDRLIAPALLDTIPQGARRFAVGKAGGGVSTPQDEIHELLIRHARAAAVVGRLIAAGRDPSSPAAVLVDATLPGQTVLWLDLETLRRRGARRAIGRPTLLVIGEVVGIGAALAGELASPGLDPDRTEAARHESPAPAAHVDHAVA